jgi:tetratricopeptide (TPR) repeat protein
VDLGKAEDLTLKGMEEDLHNTDFEKILKTVKFWQNRKELFEFKENSGEKLFKEWDKFLDFCRGQGIDNKKAVLSIKDCVFRKAVDLLIDSYRLSPVPDRETLILLGQAFYEIGVIDKAIETLEYALSLFAGDDDVRLFVMLGNLYTESGDSDLAMIMFNDAFLKFPQLVELEYIQFPAIQKIAGMVRQDGFNGNEVPEWVPVFGYLYGGLTTKRKLEYKDYIELRDKILDYEKSLKIDKKVINIIIPRLINYYLWILDYYLYQINAAGPAENVIKRILDLLRELMLDGEVKKKLINKADALLKKLLSNCKSTQKAPELVSS